MSDDKKVDTIFPAEISDWLNKIENNVYGHIDGKMLSNMLKIVFFLALKKGEVLNLKISDVIDQDGQVKDEIQIGEKQIALSAARQLIIDQLNHIRIDENYKDQDDAFLFQSNKGEQCQKESICSQPRSGSLMKQQSLWGWIQPLAGYCANPCVSWQSLSPFRWTTVVYGYSTATGFSTTIPEARPKAAYATILTKP